nr:unnamed protein product [Digitaria exilis]
MMEMVFPEVYGDSRTYFYTKWTNDGFQSTGCLNMECPGFRPEKGAAIAPGQDGTSGDWLIHAGLNREPALIGRFPRSLFTGGFSDKANAVLFGGVVAAPITNPPPMGSGYLPTSENSAASISNIQLIDQNGRGWPLTGDLPKFETNGNAYAVSPIVNGKFFYGGYEHPKM